MYIRTPRIGAVCSPDPNDTQAVDRDFAYELRQFIKTDRDGERRRASLVAIDAFEAATTRGHFKPSSTARALRPSKRIACRS